MKGGVAAALNPLDAPAPVARATGVSPTGSSAVSPGAAAAAAAAATAALGRTGSGVVIPKAVAQHRTLNADHLGRVKDLGYVPRMSCLVLSCPPVGALLLRRLVRVVCRAAAVSRHCGRAVAGAFLFRALVVPSSFPRCCLARCFIVPPLSLCCTCRRGASAPPEAGFGATVSRARGIGAGDSVSSTADCIGGFYPVAQQAEDKVRACAVAASCRGGEASAARVVAPQDLGKSVRPGFRNIARDPERVFGVPTVRTDIPARVASSVSDTQNYGNGPTAGELLNPCRFVDIGVDHRCGGCCCMPARVSVSLTSPCPVLLLQ